MSADEFDPQFANGGFRPFGTGGFVERFLEEFWLTHRELPDRLMLENLDNAWDAGFGAPTW